jgi:hypothetical protein
MKRYITFITVLLLCVAAFPQKKASPVKEVKNQLQQEMKKLEQQEARIKINEKKLELAQRERIIEAQRQKLLKGSSEYERGTHECVNRRRVYHGQRFVRMATVWFSLIFLGAFSAIIINILLTILVFTDMKNRNSFNGLWIPVILLGGVITIIGYALFRTTDKESSDYNKEES